MSLTPSSNSFNNNTTAISFPFPSPSPTYNYTNIYIKSGDICEFEAAQGKSFNYWYFGVLLSICASICSNLGVNMQKFSMTKEQTRKGENRAYICQPLWAVGLVLVIAGSVGDFVALGFAAQSLAVPVGALTMVFNVLFAHYWLGEDLNRKDMLATFMVMIGVVCVAAFGNKKPQCFSMNDLLLLYTEPFFLGYVAVLIPLLMILYFLANRADIVLFNNGPNSIEYSKWKKIHPLLYPIMSGFWGAQSVLFAKSIAEMVKLTIRGHNQFTWISIVIFILMCLTILTQIHFLAKGLQNFDAIFVVPIFQSAFIVGAIFVGATYFQEFTEFSFLQMIFFPSGIVIIIIGVSLLAQRKMAVTSSISPKDLEEKEMLFTRRQDMLDETPGVVLIVRSIRTRLTSPGPRHFNTEGSESPSKKNTGDMSLSNIEEDGFEELESATYTYVYADSVHTRTQGTTKKNLNV